MPKNTDPQNPECKHMHVHVHVNYITNLYGKSTKLCTCILCFTTVVEGKRSSGLTAIWLARNRFAMLDKSHQVRRRSLVLDSFSESYRDLV